MCLFIDGFQKNGEKVGNRWGVKFRYFCCIWEFCIGYFILVIYLSIIVEYQVLKGINYERNVYYYFFKNIKIILFNGEKSFNLFFIVIIYID